MIFLFIFFSCYRTSALKTSQRGRLGWFPKFLFRWWVSLLHYLSYRAKQLVVLSPVPSFILAPLFSANNALTAAPASPAEANPLLPLHPDQDVRDSTAGSEPLPSGPLPLGMLLLSQFTLTYFEFIVWIKLSFESNFSYSVTWIYTVWRNFAYPFFLFQLWIQKWIQGISLNPWSISLTHTCCL